MVSTGDVLWRQSEDSMAIEFTTAIIMPEGARPRDLTVVVKEEEVVVVKYQDSVLLQWRLSLPVEEEVTWSLADGKINIELTKKSADMWPQLVGWPLSAADKAFATEDELDKMIASELPRLPPLKEKTDDKEEEEEKPKEDEDGEVDLDAILDEAENEIHPLVKVELQSSEEEAKEMEEKKKEFTELMEQEEDEEKKEELRKKLEIIDRMSSINKEMRILRSEPCSMKNFFKMQELDIKKGRCNAGDLTDMETELFQDDEERAMSGKEMVQKAISMIQGDGSQFKQGLHLLRLAALHHKVSSATIILFRIYNELQNPAKGAYFLLLRANDEDCEPTTNSLCAELHEKGVRLFAPLMALAVHYHQRAAMSGSTSSMMSLANLFQRGCTANSVSDEKTVASNINLTRFNQWLKHSEDRASPSAFFALCHLYMGGDLEFDKDYHKAKSYLKRAVAAMPELHKVLPQVEAKLELLRKEEGISASPSATGSPTTGKPPAEVARRQPAPTGGARPDVASRMSMLQQNAGNAKANMENPPSKADGAKRGKGAASKKFWERTVTTGMTLFSIWTLLFPIRVMLLPQFYAVVGFLKDSMFGGLIGSIGGGPRGGALF